MTQCSVDGVERPLVKSESVPQFDTNRQVGVYESKNHENPRMKMTILRH